MSAPLASLAACHDRAVVGGKAAGLAWLSERGIAVPAHVVIPAEIFDAWFAGDATERRDLVQHAARDVLDSGLSVPLAVRSSATVEDGERASFAGQYMSILGVAADALPEAIEEVFASALSPAAARYATMRRQSAAPRMAVIVQEQIDAHLAGACLTVNPVTGASELVVEAVHGQGAELLTGTRIPDVQVRIPVDPGREADLADLDDTTRAVMRELRRVVLQIRADREDEQDIEWAADTRGLWILQVRPVTCNPHGTGKKRRP